MVFSVLVVSSGSGNIYGITEENDSLHIKFKLLSGVDVDANQIYFLESFQADPPLDQVVNRNFEIGARGRQNLR